MTIGFNMYLESYCMQQILFHLLLSQNQWMLMNLKGKLKVSLEKPQSRQSCILGRNPWMCTVRSRQKILLYQSHGVHKVRMARKQLLQYEIISFWKLRSSLMVYDNLLLFNNCIVIPTPLRKDIMERIHQGHQGIELCRMRVKSSVWWLSISKQVTEII